MMTTARVSMALRLMEATGSTAHLIQLLLLIHEFSPLGMAPALPETELSQKQKHNTANGRRTGRERHGRYDHGPRGREVGRTMRGGPP